MSARARCAGGARAPEPLGAGLARPGRPPARDAAEVHDLDARHARKRGAWECAARLRAHDEAERVPGDVECRGVDADACERPTRRVRLVRGEGRGVSD